jgi:hypothetical protein
MSTKTKSTKASKPNSKDIALSKMVLASWGNYSGKITPQGFQAIGKAVQTLKKAYSK